MKEFLEHDDVRLSSVAELAEINLFPGMICPLLDPTYSLLNLIDPAVMKADYLVTNAGSLMEYVIFGPTALLKLPAYKVKHLVE